MITTKNRIIKEESQGRDALRGFIREIKDLGLSDQDKKKVAGLVRHCRDYISLRASAMAFLSRVEGRDLDTREKQAETYAKTLVKQGSPELIVHAADKFSGKVSVEDRVFKSLQTSSEHFVLYEGNDLKGKAVQVFSEGKRFLIIALNTITHADRIRETGRGGW